MKSLFVSTFALLSAAVFAQIPDDVSLEPVTGDSELDGPLGLKHAGDGSDRIFIVEQAGRVRVLDSAGNLLVKPFIDIASRVSCCGERGLLDIAFHPNFVSNGLFYLHYSAGPTAAAGTETDDTIVAEFSLTSDPNVANNIPDRIILTVSQDFSNHNGGQMKFGPDGYLYLALGDGGNGGDPCNRAQTLDPGALVNPDSCSSDAPLNDSLALLGKMLRLDVDDTTGAGANNLCAANSDGSANYSIPSVNPFFEQEDRCGEVFLFGLRNPWRFSFDRDKDDLWIGDVGQSTWEEINLLPWPLVGGENLGWSVCEGSFLIGETDLPCSLLTATSPVLQYRTGQNGNRSVTGGYRYRGPITSLQGAYIYGDFSSGNVWLARNDSGTWQSDLFQSIGNIRSFGEDEQGNLYVYSGSTLLRFEGDTELIFDDGFEQQ